MQFNKLPGEITSLIYSFGSFKDKALCLGLLNRESNKIVNADMSYFDDWLFSLFVWNSRKLFITEWLKIPVPIPIEPLIRNVDNVLQCIHPVFPMEIVEIRDAVRSNIDRFNIVFADLNKKYNTTLWNAEENKFSVPSWKHFAFQKEVIQLCEELGST